jgi:predicted nucleic acid-binding protein
MSKSTPPRRSRGATATELAAGIRYIESSALAAALLEGDSSVRAAIRQPGRRVTSALTIAETGRAILRARRLGRLTESQERAAVQALQVFAQRCDLMGVTGAVLERAARSFPVEPVRTLDAIHLASIEVIGEPPALVTVVTRDVRVSKNARALGYRVE